MTANFTICVGTVGSGAWTSPMAATAGGGCSSGLWGESRVYGLGVHPTRAAHVFAGADDGIYKSSDGGQSFDAARLADEQDATCGRSRSIPTTPT